MIFFSILITYLFDIVRRNSVLVTCGSERVKPLKPNINILIHNTLLHCHPVVLYNDWNKHRVLGNPNWQEADQLAIYTALPRSWTWGDQEQTSKWQGGGLELKTTRLQVQHPNHSAMLPRHEKRETPAVMQSVSLKDFTLPIRNC